MLLYIIVLYVPCSQNDTVKWVAVPKNVDMHIYAKTDHLSVQVGVNESLMLDFLVF